jgi:uncharacterized protein YndB with AHSA1/START domain
LLTILRKMTAIKHLFHIAMPPETVYQALTTAEGLSNWWTRQTSGDPAMGGILQFRFGEHVGSDMKIISLKPNEVVEWECVAGPDDWIGTTVSFRLDRNDHKTRVHFEHGSWKEANDFYAACSFSWGRYMESLRQFCQTGRGEAFGSEGYRR